MKLNFISQPVYLFAICFLKLSVGFFLLRIAARSVYKRIITGIMGKSADLTHLPPLLNLTLKVFMAIYTFGCVLTVLLQCTDPRMMWDQTVKGTCWTVKQIKILGYLNTALNIMTDLAFSLGIPVRRPAHPSSKPHKR
jgi:hypothetical protein